MIKDVMNRFGSPVKAGVAILVVVLIIAGGWYWKSQNTLDTSDGKLSDRETVIAKERLAQLIKVPSEEPVVAVITDIDSLVRDQVFYQGAQNGDILFIYPKAVKAMIYSVSTGKLINVGPVIVGNNTAPAAAATASPSASPAPAPKR